MISVTEMLDVCRNPYSFKRTRVWWFGGSYRILYEDCEAFELTVGSREMAQDIVDALNIAHQVGIIDAYSYIQGMAQQ